MTSKVFPEAGALFDLSARAKLRISGNDRVRYLNGQISNDVRKSSESQAIQACVLNAKGKINANVFIVGAADSFLIDSEPETREQLAARLERYVIADDVEITDVSDEFALFHIVGSDAAMTSRWQTAQANRFGYAGVDIWTKRNEHDAVLGELAALVAVCGEEEAEILRIERGVPRWGHELTEEIIPTEANLEAAAIDYAKGCYIGQEVISRIKMSGQTNKRLCGLVSPDSIPLAQGMRLITADERKDVGWITSATMSSRLDKQIALGFLKRGFQSAGLRLLASNSADGVATEGIAVEVVALPFG